MTASPKGGLRTGTTADACAVAALHAEQIPEGFLVTLGPRFLERLYRRIGRSTTAFVLVSDDASGLSGFVAVAERTGSFYREFLWRDGLPAGLVAAPAVLRSPGRIWETLRYGAVTDTDLPTAEILAIAVDPRAQGQGVGGRLLRAALAELRRREVPGVRVVTAATNTSAVKMYERAGFTRRGRTEVHAGVAQEVLVWG